MRNSIKFLTLILIVVTFASCTSNQETTELNKGKRVDVAQMFTNMDSNKDGKISAIEAKGKLRENFRKRDRNNDGYITRDELGRKK
jgi:Ca2+-binding EF-hand superfamily protein